LEKYILVLTTVPDEEIGQKIASDLVKAKLAACVTLSSTCKSFYWWKKEIVEDQECMLFIKTKASLYPELEKNLLKSHPYDVPEIIALPLTEGYSEYLKWITSETK